MEEQKEKRYMYTREEIARRIFVPKIVENDLKGIVEERLQQCGLYHRVFSRIKSADSLEHKYDFKEYNQDKKIQDLVGLRIDMYFEDDLAICQRIMERSFELIEWSNSQSKEEEFKATKINGVFHLPQYLKNKISPDTWEMGIDDTFEIQLKTMFFEGWHEIEHDMRYKRESVWKNRLSFSRYFNSILATLELCDKSMVTLFEDLGHDLYKAGQWADMIKVHFRVKMGDEELYPEVEQVLNDSYRNTVENLAKRLFKCNRTRLIDQLMKRNWRVPINVNTIIALMNECLLHDERLREIFKKRDVYNAGRIESQISTRSYELRPLVAHKVFQACVLLDTAKYGIQATFEKASGYIYQWAKDKYGELLTGMPAQIETFYGEQQGYNVGVIYDVKQQLLRIRTVHIDLNVGGRMWVTQAQILKHGEELYFYTKNSYMEPEDRKQQEQELYFSFPRFYRDIADNIGIIDARKCINTRRVICDPQVEGVKNLIESAGRMFPVVLILSEEAEDGMMDERWLGQFRVSDFTKSVWRYAHVFTGYEKSGRKLLREIAYLDDKEVQSASVTGVYIFWPGYHKDHENVLYYSPADVKNCSFGRHREMRNDVHTYDIVKGGQAFYHKILMDIRDYNVTVDFELKPLHDYYRSRIRLSELPQADDQWQEIMHEYNAYNEELISENQHLKEKNEQLQRELFRLKRQKQ